MKATLIGILVGFAAILFIGVWRGMEKRILYGLTLTGIGFLYVGFTWTDPLSLGINIVQAVVFVFISYFGIRKPAILITGYFLHGLWDLGYGYMQLPSLRPPDYDLFCLAIDVTMGLYLGILQRRSPDGKQVSHSNSFMKELYSTNYKPNTK